MLGFLIINRQHDPDSRQHLLCVNGNEWVYLTTLGNLFGTCLQLLILMQINITQYVMVKTPRNMGIFDEDKTHDVGVALRAKLLAGINDELSDEDKAEN